MLGIPVKYKMSDGEDSDVLVAGIPMESLNQALFLYTDENRAYSHILDTNGNFVIRSGDAYRDSYFERINESFEDYNGKTVKQYKNEMQLNDTL